MQCSIEACRELIKALLFIPKSVGSISETHDKVVIPLKDSRDPSKQKLIVQLNRKTGELDFFFWPGKERK